VAKRTKAGAPKPPAAERFDKEPPIGLRILPLDVLGRRMAGADPEPNEGYSVANGRVICFKRGPDGLTKPDDDIDMGPLPDGLAAYSGLHLPGRDPARWWIGDASAIAELERRGQALYEAHMAVLFMLEA
jgi:hypothetical protein